MDQMVLVYKWTKCLNGTSLQVDKMDQMVLVYKWTKCLNGTSSHVDKMPKWHLFTSGQNDQLTKRQIGNVIA